MSHELQTHHPSPIHPSLREKAHRGLYRNLVPGAVLDIPAGDGSESLRLAALGNRVCSVDLIPPPTLQPGLSWVRADANESFPFCDGAFDCVVSREGIEHLENQAAFLRECARVLKGGGTLMITTPNLLHVAARASQFLTGQRNLRRGLVNEVQTPRSLPGPHMYHGHAFLIDYFRMRYLLRLAGFGRLRIATDRYSPTSIFLSWLVPVLYAAMRFSARTAHRAARKKSRVASPPELTAEIIGHVLSPALLFGKRMIITAEKIRA